ncbi:hypothetical protein QSV37_18690 [Acinetobacter sp. VNK23]|uniref:hypothetical protein n=1 Tax=Acinetobacter thutiue TaxID=2998078 RepID=UPI002575177A|nr:hypothetical protein [Acinetobacter thutiue]MDM1022290.1 hypothetical protein [Acinetobacter thutiue]
MNKFENLSETKEILGCSLSELNELIETVYLMTWEQVLLVVIYTRQQFFYKDDRLPDDPISFSNKMQLINILFDESNGFSDSLSNLVLQKIESYEDIHSITSFLWSLKNENQKGEHTEEANKLLSLITSRHITFSGKKYLSINHLYSYKVMNHCLYNLIDILQLLLESDVFSEKKEEDLLKALKYSITGKYHLSPDNKIGIELRKKEDLQSALLFLEEKNKNKEFILDKSSINIGIHKYFSEELGQTISTIFTNVEEGSLKNYRGYKVKNYFDGIVEVKHENGKKIIEIDNIYFNNLVSLGQFKSVMNAIEYKLTNRSFRNENDDSKSLKAINEWYLKSKTGLVSKKNIPTLIASVLFFDISERIGSFDIDYGIRIPVKKENKFFVKDFYLLTCGIIYRFLYKNDKISKLPYDNTIFISFNKDEYLSEIKDFIMCQYDNRYNPKSKIYENLDNLPEVSDKIMHEWANINFDEHSSQFKAMINRSKKLPHYLKAPKKSANQDKTWNIATLIDQQRMKMSQYPINSSFPLPLWVDMTMKEKEEN